MRHRFILSVLAAAILACGLSVGCSPLFTVQRHLGLMGTSLEIEATSSDSREIALEASETAVRALEQTEARLSTWREDSELTRLNRAPVGQAVPISPELAADLAAARKWWRATGGAFDPGVGALVDAWDLRGKGRLPSPAERAAAVEAGGFQWLELGEGTATRMKDGLRIEEGGFGKGIGLDAAMGALEGTESLSVTLDLGGQVAVYPVQAEAHSLKERRMAFEVADPRRRGRPVVRVWISGGSLATSGNSEHGIRVDGVDYGHLLDPRTGNPAPDFGSLTVWAPDATAADCLSTGLYVLGPDAALAWAEEREGIEVLILEPAGDRLLAGATSGFADRIHALVADVDLVIAGIAP